MAKTKSDQFNPKDLLTIPNLITYFRVLCIPVFVVFSVLAGQRSSELFLYLALGTFAVAAASDVLDGVLARKFNWGTGVGMLLDPLADKLMHISVAACLAFAIKLNGVDYQGYAYFLHWGFVVAILFKELIMIVVAPIVAKTGVVVKANMVGKVASATLSGGVILCFFHQYIAPWDWAIVLTAVAQSYASAVNYLVEILRAIKALKIKEAEEAEAQAAENK
jgi:cardiolipin synthase